MTEAEKQLSDQDVYTQVSFKKKSLRDLIEISNRLVQFDRSVQFLRYICSIYFIDLFICLIYLFVLSINCAIFCFLILINLMFVAVAAVVAYSSFECISLQLFWFYFLFFILWPIFISTLLFMCYYYFDYFIVISVYIQFVTSLCFLFKLFPQLSF